MSKWVILVGTVIGSNVRASNNDIISGSSSCSGDLALLSCIATIICGKETEIRFVIRGRQFAGKSELVRFGLGPDRFRALAIIDVVEQVGGFDCVFP